MLSTDLKSFGGGNAYPSYLFAFHPSPNLTCGFILKPPLICPACQEPEIRSWEGLQSVARAPPGALPAGARAPPGALPASAGTVVTRDRKAGVLTGVGLDAACF